jgi:hypothetical protein
MSNEAALFEIQKLLPISQNPDRVTTDDWRIFEDQERVFLPDDFKAFIDLYGCGSLNNTLFIRAPMCLERKGSLKSPSKLRAEFIQTVLLAPIRAVAQIPEGNSTGQPINLPSFNDLVNTPMKRHQEALTLEQKFQEQYPVQAERSDYAMLEAFQNFLVKHYQSSDPQFAQEIGRANVSSIKLSTTDYTQHQANSDYLEIFQEQLEDFVAISKNSDANRFYLWGYLRDSNYGLGWLGKDDGSGVHLLEDKVFLFDKDEFAVLEMSFSEFVLQVLRQDQTLLERLGFDFDLDEAFRAKSYEYVPNPHRR